MQSLSYSPSISQEIVELDEEDLQAVHAGFFSWLVPALLIAYAIKKGKPDVKVSVTVPPPSFTSDGVSGGSRSQELAA
jgi:hypothetical protein